MCAPVIAMVIFRKSPDFDGIEEEEQRATLNLTLVLLELPCTGRASQPLPQCTDPPDATCLGSFHAAPAAQLPSCPIPLSIASSSAPEHLFCHDLDTLKQLLNKTTWSTCLVLPQRDYFICRRTSLHSPDTPCSLRPDLGSSTEHPDSRSQLHLVAADPHERIWRRA